MTEQHYDFVQGFMAAINLYGENPFTIDDGRQETDGALSNFGATINTKKEKTVLPYEKYLEIPTYIRLGKNLHI